MKKEEKTLLTVKIKEKIEQSNSFYITDTSELNSKDTSVLRRKCFESEVNLIVAKNTIIKKALEQLDEKYKPLLEVLKGTSALMFSKETNAPAKLIKEFRKTNKKPLIKAAYIEEMIYLGDNQLDSLVNIKSKEELIDDIILMLKTPINNVISALQTGQNNLSGIIKTLSDK